MSHFTTNLLGRKIKITDPALKDKPATIVAVWCEKEHDLHVLASLETGELKTLSPHVFILEA